MTKWLRRARLLIGVFAIVFPIVVFFAFKRRGAPASTANVVRTDPGAIVQSTGGRITRVTLSREDVSKVLPLTTLNYIIVAVLAQLLLAEPVTALRWTGIGFIVLGVFLVGRT